MGRTLLNLAAGLVAWVAGTAAAQPELYISEYGTNPRMSAVRWDGSNARRLFALPSSTWLPIGLTYRPADGRLYWMDSAGASQILRAGLNGSGQSTVTTTTGFGRGASLDAMGRVYFSTNNMVQRVNNDGSGLVTLYTSPTSPFPVHPPRVDAANGHLYFGDDGKIVRTNLDGGDVKVVIGGVSQARAITLDIGRGKIYWIDADTISDHVARANLDGSAFEIIADASPSVVQSSGLIDVIADITFGRVYYADELAAQVFSVDLDGGASAPVFTSDAGAVPSGLVFSTGEPLQAVRDCNGNGIPDDADIAAGAADCDNNGVPDSCQASACVSRVFLLDHGSDASSSSGRALGFPSAWEAFQPIDVPAGGWTVGEIGLDGFTVNYHDGGGFTVHLYEDDGSGEFPDESELLAIVPPMNFRFNINYENWQYAPMPVTLAEGRYWVRVSATRDATTYHATLNYGFSGAPAKSRGSSGNFSDWGRPLALRLTRGTCDADFNGDGFLDFFDYDDYVGCFEIAECPAGRTADFNGDGFADFFDYDAFVAAFENGC